MKQKFFFIAFIALSITTLYAQTALFNTNIFLNKDSSFSIGYGGSFDFPQNKINYKPFDESTPKENLLAEKYYKKITEIPEYNSFSLEEKNFIERTVNDACGRAYFYDYAKNMGIRGLYMQDTDPLHKLIKTQKIRNICFNLACEFIKDVLSYFPKDLKKRLKECLLEAKNFIASYKSHNYSIENDILFIDGNKAEDEFVFSVKGFIVRRIIMDKIPIGEMSNYINRLIAIVNTKDVKNNPDYYGIVTINNALQVFILGECTGKFPGYNAYYQIKGAQRQIPCIVTGYNRITLLSNGNKHYFYIEEAAWFQDRRYLISYDGQVIIDEPLRDSNKKIKPKPDIKSINIPSSQNTPISNFETQWSGTGFAVANKYIITNYHVVDEAKSIIVRGVGGNNNSYSAEIVASDKFNDIAVLKINDNHFSGFGGIPYNVVTKMAEVGEDVFVLGYPLTQTMGNEIKLTNGIISSRSGFQGDVSLYQMTAPIQPGNSGGPMFDSKGNVIGIVVAHHAGAENAGYAIKTSYLKNLIESAGLNIVLPSNKNLSNLSLSEKVKRIKPFVYIIECSK